MNRRLFLGALAAPLLPEDRLARIRMHPRAGDAIQSTRRDARVVVEKTVGEAVFFSTYEDGRNMDYVGLSLEHWRTNPAWATAEVA